MDPSASDSSASNPTRRKRTYSAKVDYNVVDGKVLEMAKDFDIKDAIAASTAAAANESTLSTAPSGGNSRGSSLFKFR